MNKMKTSDLYQWGSAEVLRHFRVDASHGLDQAEARIRLDRCGYNELLDRGRKSSWIILVDQLAATMVVILILAAAVSAAVGDYKDAAVIMIMVALNALLGFTQEHRAERAMSALKKLAVPTVKVRREGSVTEISARQLVPGDVVLLEAGNLVPADCRLLEAFSLRTQEAALTGESELVDKDPGALSGAGLPLGDRRNMAYMGTIVAFGRGLAVVSETGMNTQLGAVATMVQTVQRKPTPLQRRLNRLGNVLAMAALAIVGVVFFLGLLRGEDVKLMFMTAISLAVAAVPEGLPAVVTIVLALGAQRMLKRRALVRRLPAVETLGSVTVICSDKTGTLTENRMAVTVLEAAGHRVERGENGTFAVAGQPELALLLAGGALCNDAILEPAETGSGPLHATGDPTESALVIAAARHGLRKNELEKTFPRVAELPFDSGRKRMTTVHWLPADLPQALEAMRHLSGGTPGSRCIAFVKGAVDSLLEVSTAVWVDGHREPFSESRRQRITDAHERLAGDGMRVLGIACRPVEASSAQEEMLERDLIFLGMAGIIDPPRPEAKEAVRTCKAAGIRPVMITGDHPLTARFIARELGFSDDDRFLMGQDLDRLSTAELEKVVEEVSLYARVAPEQKLKIVRALQSRGDIVAVTGDGVNDAPALKEADIGVAMGITGTDVAKEAADMVLLDDNFATIVAAVKEGRIIHDNIRKFVKYLLTTNAGELWVMLLAPFLGMPLPLLPLQILWINLVTDGLPALALGVEPAERDVMRRPPYHPGAAILGRGMGGYILRVGLLMSLTSLGLGYALWRGESAVWQTTLFTSLAFSQMSNVVAIRSERDPLWSIGLLSNRPLLGAALMTIILQLAVVYIPFLQDIFKTVALSPADLLLCLAASTAVFSAAEMEKWWSRRKDGSE